MEYYVVWKTRNGGIEANNVTINCPITTSAIVKDAVKEKLNYWERDNVDIILSWQQLENGSYNTEYKQDEDYRNYNPR